MTTSRIKTLREQAGISLLELSALTGLPEDYLRDIEEGRVDASVGDWDRMIQALNRGLAALSVFEQGNLRKKSGKGLKKPSQ